MLSPADLLEIAEAFALRIPQKKSFHEEREVSWLLLGRGYLQLDDPEGALRSLEQLREGAAEAEFRMEFAKWAFAHPQFEVGHQALNETVDDIARLEAWLGERNFEEFTLGVYSVLGESAVRRMVDCVVEGYTRTVILCQWASACRDRQAALPLLREATEVATHIALEDRDHALAVIFRGYQASGHSDEAASVRVLMQADPDTMYAPLTAQLQEALARAEEALASARKILPEVVKPVDSPANALSRYLHYRYNDLKVRWLVDQTGRGGLDDFGLELQLASDTFQRLEPARQSNIHSDVSGMGTLEFGAFLFGRAVSLSDADENLLQGEYSPEITPASRFIPLATQLFLDFASIARSYSEAQIQQGLWFLLSEPRRLGEVLSHDDVSLPARIACLEAMVVPFRDYLQKTEEDSDGGFYMWWDLMRITDPAVLPTARRVLEQILQMRGWLCQKAALHGLNHLRPDWEASAIVARYLDEHGSTLPPDDLEWAERCRDGKAQ